MTYRVQIRMTGDDSYADVFNEDQSAAAACKEVFDNYFSQGWITDYNATIVSELIKDETIDFVSEEKWTDFKAEMATASGNQNVSQFNTKEITSESYV